MLTSGGQRTALLAAVALVGLLIFAACGNGDDDTTDPTADATTVSGAIDITGVPELEDGVLTAGSDIAYAPMEFYLEGTETPAGVDIDIAKAIAALLGVDVEFINTGFDGIILSLNTEDFDIIMSSMTITDERSEQIDFVPYLSVGTGILVPAGNPNGIESQDDLCGLTVAVQLGTIQEQFVNDLSAGCADAIDVVTFDTNPLAVEDLRTGGADANLADFPAAFVDADESDGDLEVVSTQIDPEPYGIGVRKEATALFNVLEEAIATLIASGEYGQILASWSLESTALN